MLFRSAMANVTPEKLASIRNNTAVIKSFAPELQEGIYNAFVHSFHIVFISALPVTLLGLVLAFFLRETRPATYYSFRDRRVFNRGVELGFVERHVRRPVPVLSIRPLSTPRDNLWRSGERSHVGIYRPNIAALPPGQAPRFDPRRPQGNDFRRAPINPPTTMVPRGPAALPPGAGQPAPQFGGRTDRKSTRLNSSH